MGDPPDGGVVEEESFDRDLQEVDEIVMAADVGEFVGEDGLELGDGQLADEGGGEEDDGMEIADDGGGGDKSGLEEGDGAADVQAGGEVVGLGEQVGRERGGLGVFEMLEVEPADEVA
jgi:hypothetical protein